MAGIFDGLTEAQKKAALGYRGPEGHGEAGFRLTEFSWLRPRKPDASTAIARIAGVQKHDTNLLKGTLNGGESACPWIGRAPLNVLED